jgi:hypothetical protein
MEKMEKTGPECARDFESLAEEIEDDIAAAADLRTALGYAGYMPENAEEWITTALGT